jgi:hypothetical protein
VGFGPGRGGSIIGLQGGYDSDAGTLVQATKALQGAGDYVCKTWKTGLLPFCEWGCTLFSCVDCTEPQYPVYLHDEGVVRPQHFTFNDFLQRWIDGKDLLTVDDGTVSEAIEFINPFTGQPAQFKRRRKK